MATDFDPGTCPDVSQLMAAARGQTGLDDLGDPDREAGLEAYVRSLRDDSWAGMTAAARTAAIDYLVHNLIVRLRLIADRKANPDIAAERITAPIIVVGPPRSGSTLLHNLLSLDTDNRAPEHWVCREPSPPPQGRQPDDTRRAAADARMAGLFDLIPDIFVTHPYMIEEGSGALAECGSDIMSIVGTSQQLWCFWGGETYQRYLLEADHHAALGFHHDFLQHLQWGTGGRRWALKGSDHMLWLAELAERYPDATLVWTHRDLGQQLGSLASVQSILLGLRGSPVTPEQRRAQGERAVALQRASVAKAIAARDTIGDDRFIDISYHDMLSDPLDIVNRIYAKAGLEVSADHAGAILAWLEHNKQTKHGVHRHSPEEFGLSPDVINADFGDYVDRFGHGFGIRPAAAA